MHLIADDTTDSEPEETSVTQTDIKTEPINNDKKEDKKQNKKEEHVSYQIDETKKEDVKEDVKEEMKVDVKEDMKVETKVETTEDVKEHDEFENIFDKKQRKYKKNEENGDKEIIHRDDKLVENKQIYDENKTYGDIGNDKKLNSYWTVWVHKINNPDWKLTGYQKIYVINSIGSFWRFFNNFQLLNTYHNQIFIMREEIAPIWEDVNNKFGGICSLKIDSIQRGLKTDLSTEVFSLISLLVMNETFVGDSKNINGISYSVKKRSSLIKLWTKNYSPEYDFTKDLPVPLMNKFNNEMQKQSKNNTVGDGKVSIQYKQIKPEFEI
jgi:hypothetical protein